MIFLFIKLVKGYCIFLFIGIFLVKFELDWVKGKKNIVMIKIVYWFVLILIFDLEFKFKVIVYFL